jgi:superfamily II DNA or RNA helicase
MTKDHVVRLRPYQQEALDGICGALRECDSTLLTLPTGCGKTVVFSAAAKIAKKRVMIIAHRDELITQGAQKLMAVTGERAGIEKAEQYSNERSMFPPKCVVASVQTLNARMGQGRRFDRFDPNDFSLLIIDEAHHAVATSYRNVIEHFQKNPSLKVVGVTATPDRSDEVAMKTVFESVAYEYGLIDAIRDGWLVSIRSMPARIVGLDLGSLRDVAGDFHQGELSQIMEEEKNLHAVATETLARMGKRKVLVFCVSVAQSERLAEIFDRHVSGIARFVSGETPADERRQMLRDFDEGRFQILVNCMVATEGFDCPSIGMVVVARPTKSRALYAQMVGRGTRPLPGTVDGPETPEARKSAILSSAKPDCIVIDFCGNTGRHNLAGLPDILGGKMPDAVVAKARAAQDDAADDNVPIDVIELLEKAEKEIEAEERKRRDKDRRKSIKVRGIVDVKEIDPFAVYGIPQRKEPAFRALPLTEGQKDLLRKQGVPFERMDSWKQRELFKETVKRFKQNKCSFRQAKLLGRFGYSADCSFEEARAIIDRLSKNNWRKVD